MRPRLLFWVLDILHSQAPQTDFHAKYVKRRGSAQGRAFWGLDNKNLTFIQSNPIQSIYLSAVNINRIDDYYSSEKHSDGLPEKQRSSKLAAHNQLTYKHN